MEDWNWTFWKFYWKKKGKTPIFFWSSGPPTKNWYFTSCFTHFRYGKYNPILSVKILHKQNQLLYFHSAINHIILEDCAFISGKQVFRLNALRLIGIPSDDFFFVQLNRQSEQWWSKLLMQHPRQLEQYHSLSHQHHILQLKNKMLIFSMNSSF